MPELETLRAQQALSILETIETLPPGRSVTVVHLPGGGWSSFVSVSPSDHRGESATDALGQLTTVMALEGG